MAVVLIAGKIHQAGLDLLRGRGDESVVYVKSVATEACLTDPSDCDAVLLRTQPLTGGNGFGPAPTQVAPSGH